MNFLVRKLNENKKFKQYVEDIKNKVSPINLSGLVDVEKTHIVAGTMQNIERQVCVITYNEMQAKKMISDLQAFLSDEEDKHEKSVVYFPKKEISSYDYVSQSKDLPFERIEALNKIVQNKASIVVTTVEAVMQTMPNNTVLYNDEQAKNI